MSFTTEIKLELCKLPIHINCCVAAELYGFLLYANQFTTEKIKLYSDNSQVRKRVSTLLRKLIKTACVVDDSGSITISDIETIKQAYNIFGYEYQGAAHHLNRAVVEEDCCKNAFLRGVFLASGYLSEPEKSYHLELVTTHYNIAGEVLLLLDEIDLGGKLINRRGNFVIYYKDSETIEKILTAMGATNGAMDLMLKKVEKNLRNNVNRKVNCETSNLSKTADAASTQIQAIERILQKGIGLPRVLMDTAMLRCENPEMTLAELAELCEPPITKPGISGRMRKLMKIAKEV